MRKQNKTSDKHENGNDFIAYVGRSSFFINHKEWDLFQWLYAHLLWWISWCVLINLIAWAFS